MKRIALLLSGILLAGRCVSAAQPLDATLTRDDGRAWRVVLIGCDTNQLTYHLENDSTPKILPLPQVRSLEIKLPELDLRELNARLVSADYQGVVSELEPAVGAVAPYMVVPNNAVDAFALLTKAHLRNGDVKKALEAATNLQAVQDPKLKAFAADTMAQAALEQGDLAAAKQQVERLSDPAAALYLTARIQRAEQQSKDAMQTVIELIASHPNDHDWMPQTEYLCAQLYMDLDMLESAAEVARQVQVLYPGSEFKVEAERLHEQINQLIKQSEQAE
jgi:tetratricopeptide (TPR) repeat protein